MNDREQGRAREPGEDREEGQRQGRVEDREEGHNQEQVEDVLRRLLQQAASEPPELSTTQTVRAAADTVRAENLKKRWQVLSEENQFEAGMIVQWKPGLKNKTRPEYGEPGIVTQVLPDPVHDPSNEAGSPYFREPLDIIVGIIDPNADDFLLLYYDSRRFRPFDEER